MITLPYGTFVVSEQDGWLNAQAEHDQFWDLDLRRYLDRAPSGSIVIDVGAHVGFYTGYCASRGCDVVAFEAHPRYLPLLRRNIERNGWTDQVTLVPSFAYSRRCRLREVLEHDTPASNTWLPTSKQGVWATTLDLAGALCNIAPVLVKIDAQGGDLHVLLGAERLIRTHAPEILLEFEPTLAAQHDHTKADYDAWVRDHEYVAQTIGGTNLFLTRGPCHGI